MVRESEKKFRGYHPELHAVPVAGVVRGTATEVHAGLPFVLEQHYNDVKGVEHERLLEQRGLASELRTMARRMEHAAAERAEFRRQLPVVSDHVASVAVSLEALRQLAVATSTMQLHGSTPATHGAVLAAHLALEGGDADAAAAAAAAVPGAAPNGEAGTGAGLRLWRPLFIAPAALLAAVWLAVALGGIESELAGLALVPAAIGSLLAHIFGTLESDAARALWLHFVLLVGCWLAGWTVKRFQEDDWVLGLILALGVGPALVACFSRLLKLRAHLRRKQRLELSRLAPPLFVASLAMAGVQLWLTIGGLGCALAVDVGEPASERECAGRVFGASLLALHVGVVYVLGVLCLNQAHRSALLRFEISARALLDAELSPAEVKMLCLLVLSTALALLLHQVGAVAPASLWPEDIHATPPLLAAALLSAYAVAIAALCAFVVLEATRARDGSSAFHSKADGLFNKVSAIQNKAVNYVEKKTGLDLDGDGVLAGAGSDAEGEDLPQENVFTKMKARGGRAVDYLEKKTGIDIDGDGLVAGAEAAERAAGEGPAWPGLLDRGLDRVGTLSSRAVNWAEKKTGLDIDGDGAIAGGEGQPRKKRAEAGAEGTEG